jgi:phosphatidylserine decarboxylase
LPNIALNIGDFVLMYSPNQITCNETVIRGEELGWFQHGSTIIVFAPHGYQLLKNLTLGRQILMGEALFERLI